MIYRKLCLYFLILSSGEGLRMQRPSLFPPSISLRSYTEIDTLENIPAEDGFHSQNPFENDFISKNGSDYIVLRGIQYIVFSCSSSSPVTWAFPNMNQLDDIPAHAFQMATTRSSTWKRGQVQPRNIQFEAYLLIQFTFFEFFSATLECKVPESPTGNTAVTPSVHVYYKGTHLLEKMGQTIELKVPPHNALTSSGDDFFILPCRPASPNYHVTLEEQGDSVDEHGTVSKIWKKIQLSAALGDFDPKVGFKVPGPPSIVVPNDVSGFYKCSVLDDSYQDEESIVSDPQLDIDLRSLYINVTTSHESESLPGAGDTTFEATLQLGGNASVLYNEHHFGNNPPLNDIVVYNDGTGTTCCTGVPPHVPTFCAHTCDDPIQCQIGRRQLSKAPSEMNSICHTRYQLLDRNRSDCSSLDLYENMLFSCTGGHLKFTENFFNIFEADMMNVSNRSEGRSTQQMVSLSISKYEAEAFVSTAPLSLKVIIVVGQYMSSEELLRNRHRYVIHGGLQLSQLHWLHSGVGIVEEDMDNQVLQESEAYQYGLSYHDMQGGKITEYPRDVYYEGEPLVSVCLTWRNLYSEGIHMSMLWRNGTRTVFPSVNLFEARHKTLFFDGGVQATGAVRPFMVIHQTTPELKASKEMMSIECWVPEWNTTKWDKLTKNLTILDPPPQSSPI